MLVTATLLMTLHTFEVLEEGLAVRSVSIRGGSNKIPLQVCNSLSLFAFFRHQAAPAGLINVIRQDVF